MKTTIFIAQDIETGDIWMAQADSENPEDARAALAEAKAESDQSDGKSNGSEFRIQKADLLMQACNLTEFMAESD